MNRLRRLLDRLLCRRFGHRSLYWWEYEGRGGDACQRCGETFWLVGGP